MGRRAKVLAKLELPTCLLVMQINTLTAFVFFCVCVLCVIVAFFLLLLPCYCATDFLLPPSNSCVRVIFPLLLPPLLLLPLLLLLELFMAQTSPENEPFEHEPAGQPRLPRLQTTTEKENKKTHI